MARGRGRIRAHAGVMGKARSGRCAVLAGCWLSSYAAVLHDMAITNPRDAPLSLGHADEPRVSDARMHAVSREPSSF